MIGRARPIPVRPRAHARSLGDRLDRPGQHLAADLGYEIPPQGGGRRARGQDGRGDLAPRRGRAGRARGGPGGVGGALSRRAHGFRVPARGPHRRRRRHGPQRHPLQLLRHGRDPGRHGRHLHQSQGSRPDHAARWGHRLRFLDLAAQGRAGEGGRRRRLRPPQLHGRVGRHVPHDHERGPPPRRHDGDATLRPPGYRGLRRGQARARAPAHVQPLGPWSPTPS